VDWIQFPFEVDAKVHRGEGAPTVRLRWMYTDLPFLPVGTGCVINNRVWNDDQDSDLEVGQLPRVECDFVQDARWVLPFWVQGGHICRPDWLVTGEPWPNALPPTNYTPTGIPFCCCVDQYTVHSDEVAVVAPVTPSECERWIGLGDVTGKQWVVIAPGSPALPLWRVWRRKNGLPTFYTWECPDAWDGRGRSPPFVLAPPLQPGAPVAPVYVEEVIE